MYEHIWNGKELIQRFFGQTSFDEIQHSVMRLEGDSRFDTLRHSIVDFTDCLGLHDQAGTMEEIAAIDGASSRTNSSILISVITDKPEFIRITEEYVDFGLSNYPLQIFNSVDDARKGFEITSLRTG